MERPVATTGKGQTQRSDQSEPYTLTRQHAVPTTSESTVDDAWSQLREITLDSRRLNKQRVMSLRASVNSAPFDLLRTRMLQKAKQNGWRRIGFVSPHSGCGKSTTMANAAFSLARQSDARTIVFDFDLRRHALTSLLGQQTDTSLVHMLEGHIDFAEHGVRYGKNVAFALNRSATSHASEILQSGKTQEVLERIEATYAPDLMLFDLPPLMATDDNFGFLNTVDAALILTAAEKTTMSQIDVAERQVADLTTVMGVILNKCRHTSGAYGYEYNYY